jgi:AraC-like DNA-binding protein
MMRTGMQAPGFESTTLANATHKYVWIKHYDLDKLHIAKTLLEQNITTPCSLHELAKRAGLNEFKLKRGFKELFGTTVFGYLHEQRMVISKRMLLENMSVTEVSEYCGYTYVQSFITAFRKKYGITPDKFKNKMAACNEQPFY